MNAELLRQLLEAVHGGQVGIDEAMDRLRHLPFESLKFANVDHHRAVRCGFPEVIYCEGKTVEQVVKIVETLVGQGGNVLATRATPEMYAAIADRFDAADYHEQARAITLRQIEPRWSEGVAGIV